MQNENNDMQMDCHKNSYTPLEQDVGNWWGAGERLTHETITLEGSSGTHDDAYP